MLVTNGKAVVVQKYAYDAYGNNYEGSFAGSNNIGYNGKRYDGGTGWYDYGFRDYDSRTGRFTTVDPIRDGMNWYAYCGGDPINCVDLWGLEGSDRNLQKRQAIAELALSNENSTMWSYFNKKDNFRENTNKCNKFVYDMTTESGATPGLPNGNIVKKIFGAGSPPTAAQWADPNYNIPNWRVLQKDEVPLPGDVIAEAHNYSDATGHCGIITGEKQTTSASSKTQTIVTNDWGFREGNNVTIRRYTGE